MEQSELVLAARELQNYVVTLRFATHSHTRIARADAMRLHTPTTILVVDDDPAIRRLLRTALEEFGYRVLLASNGLHALKLFENHAADVSLVLTDISMPMMDGPTFIGELLVRGLPRQIPILFMSGGKAQVPPGYVHIAKPFLLAQLTQTIEQFLPSK